MNCWEAQELLEGFDFGAIGGDDALVVEARRHVAQCSSCRNGMSPRLVWNRQLSAAMSDVTIPDGLESRLLERLSPLALATVTAEPSRPSRRRWLMALVALAAVLLLAVAWRPWPTSSSRVSLAVVDANIGSDLTELTHYDPSRWTPELPQVWRSFFQLEPDLVHHFPSGSPRVLSVAALVPFEFRASPGATPIRGRLVMVPVSYFLNPPEERDFSVVSDVEYIPGYSRCVWREGDWVYLCYVRSVGGAELRELMELMRQTRNFT